MKASLINFKNEGCFIFISANEKTDIVNLDLHRCIGVLDLTSEDLSLPMLANTTYLYADVSKSISEEKLNEIEYNKKKNVVLDLVTRGSNTHLKGISF